MVPNFVHAPPTSTLFPYTTLFRSDYWQQRLTRYGGAFEPTTSPFGEAVLRFQDPHGLRLALVATEQERPFVPWDDSPVPPARSEETRLNSSHVRISYAVVCLETKM